MKPICYTITARLTPHTMTLTRAERAILAHLLTLAPGTQVTRAALARAAHCCERTVRNAFKKGLAGYLTGVSLHDVCSEPYRSMQQLRTKRLMMQQPITLPAHPEKSAWHAPSWTTTTAFPHATSHARIVPCGPFPVFTTPGKAPGKMTRPQGLHPEISALPSLPPARSLRDCPVAQLTSQPTQHPEKHPEKPSQRLGSSSLASARVRLGSACADLSRMRVCAEDRLSSEIQSTQEEQEDLLLSEQGQPTREDTPHPLQDLLRSHPESSSRAREAAMAHPEISGSGFSECVLRDKASRFDREQMARHIEQSELGGQLLALPGVHKPGSFVPYLTGLCLDAGVTLDAQAAHLIARAYTKMATGLPTGRVAYPAACLVANLKDLLGVTRYAS